MISLVDQFGTEMRQKIEVPAGVIAELQAFHPLLGIQYLPIHRTWALTWNWGMDAQDPRNRHVQGGRVPSKMAYSILCILPDDCSPSEALGFARNNLIVNPPSDYWQKVCDAIDRDNLNREEAVTNAALADVNNRIELASLFGKARFNDEDENAKVLSPEELGVEVPHPDEIRAARNNGVFH